MGARAAGARVASSPGCPGPTSSSQRSLQAPAVAAGGRQQARSGRRRNVRYTPSRRIARCSTRSTDSAASCRSAPIVSAWRSSRPPSRRSCCAPSPPPPRRSHWWRSRASVSTRPRWTAPRTRCYCCSAPPSKRRASAKVSCLSLPTSSSSRLGASTTAACSATIARLSSPAPRRKPSLAAKAAGALLALAGGRERLAPEVATLHDASAHYVGPFSTCLLPLDCGDAQGGNFSSAFGSTLSGAGTGRTRPSGTATGTCYAA
mmetsp:Transcript_31436/g.101724  ORF Transcript_31436/g.101724 Transcript_31436/m.101724 type:complete len:261 (-) Transcript_31436:147-929(-)